MTQDELTLLLLTLSPAELLEHYPPPARADLVVFNLLQRYPDLAMERLLHAAYNASRTPAARDARLVYCVEKVRSAVPDVLLRVHVMPQVTSGLVGIYFGDLVRHQWGGTWNGVAVTLNAFEVRLCRQRDVTVMSSAVLVATADCLAELRRLDDPDRTDRVERYRADLVEIFEAWCAL